MPEHRPHERRAGLGRLAEEFAQVGAEAFAQADVRDEDLLRLGAVGPDFVGRAGAARAAALGAGAGLLRVAAAVQAHHRREGPEGEPAHEQLAELRGPGVDAEEAAEVAVPPRDAGHAGGEADGDLVAERPPVRRDVAGPEQGAVLLRAGPRAAGERDDLRLAVGAEPFVDHPLVFARVEVADARRGAVVEEEVVGVGRAGLGLRQVEPERAEAVGAVGLAEALPDPRAGGGVRGVEVLRARAGAEALVRAADRADEEAALLQLGAVARALVDGRPHGDDRLDAHRAQLAHHPGRVGPEGAVEVPVALVDPVEVVGHDRGERDAELAVAARDAHQLVLRAVAALALPEAERPLGHRGGVAGGVRVGAQDRGGRRAGDDPPVDAVGGRGAPGHEVAAEDGGALRGVVPEQAVAARGDDERDGGLRVALHELQLAALEVEVRLLVLAHAPEALVRVRLEALRDRPAARREGAELARGHALDAAARRVGVAHVLLEEELAGKVAQDQATGGGDLGLDRRGAEDAAAVWRLGARGGGRPDGLVERAGLGVHRGLVRGADADARAVRLDPEELGSVADLEAVVREGEDHSQC